MTEANNKGGAYIPKLWDNVLNVRQADGKMVPAVTVKLDGSIEIHEPYLTRIREWVRDIVREVLQEGGDAKDGK